MSTKSLSTNQRLALAGFILGAVALFGSPSNNGVARIDTQDLALLVENEVDHVTADVLADWIIKGQADFRLIDIRDEAAFAEYHIPTAENATITGLADHDIQRNEVIVLYSDGGIHSAQAWFLLKAKGFTSVYMLLDGLNAWKEDILFPTISENAAPDEKIHFAMAAERAKYFGGSARGVQSDSVQPAEITLPEVKAPARPVVPATKQKKRREGC